MNFALQEIPFLEFFHGAAFHHLLMMLNCLKKAEKNWQKLTATLFCLPTEELSAGNSCLNQTRINSFISK